MGSYMGAIWRCRYFWLSLVKIDLRTRYRGSLLGMGWSLLQPLAMTVIICTVFHRMFQVPIAYFAPFLLCGLSLWNFVVNVTLQGCHCFKAAESYIRQYPAPLAIYPLRAVLGCGFHFGVALVITLILAGCLHGLSNLPALLSLIPTVALLLIFGWSLALLGGLMNVHFPDTSHLTEVAFQGLFYLTPIMYPPEFLNRDTHLTHLFGYNPLVFFLKLLRQPILDGQVPSLTTFLGATLTVLLTVSVASYLLHRLERRFIYYL